MNDLPIPTHLEDKDTKHINQQMFKYVDQGHYSDVTITSSDGKQFSVHRIVLAARSPYFHALFTSGLGEIGDSSSSSLKLIDVDSTSLKIILSYIYTSELTGLTLNNFLDVYKGLDRLQVLDATDTIEQFLIESIGLCTCVSIFQLASMYFAPKAAEVARCFILEEFTTIPISILQFLQFEEFYSIIQDDRLNVRREEQTYARIKEWCSVDEANRVIFFSTLLRLVRFGNAGIKFIETKVLTDDWIQGDDEIKAYLEAANLVLHDIQADPQPTKFDVETHRFLRPRIPRDVVFAFGGWTQASASNVMETYDSRVNKWYQTTSSSDFKPRAYHGMVTFQDKIWVIGGFNGHTQVRNYKNFI